MSAYRFCRTDDIPLLVEALNRCWCPWFPGEPEMTIPRFKREIRELQVWCSSCMVAFAGSDPIGVLIGAKRSGETLVHRIAVHPDYRRQGHGRHLLTSLSSKLSILGPPRIVAEVACTAGPAHALFAACGFTRDGAYTDFVLDPHLPHLPHLPHAQHLSHPRDEGAGPGVVLNRELAGKFVIPITIDDLAANGLLDWNHPGLCWERSVETLAARKNEIEGVAIASDERIEAYLLYAREEPRDSDIGGTDVLACRCHVDGPVDRHLPVLLGHLAGQRPGPVRIVKLHPDEIPAAVLRELGFCSTGVVHARYTADARGA